MSIGFRALVCMETRGVGGLFQIEPYPFHSDRRLHIRMAIFEAYSTVVSQQIPLFPTALLSIWPSLSLTHRFHSLLSPR